MTQLVFDLTDRSGYPLGGDKLRSAWLAAFKLLAPGQWVEYRTLVRAMEAAGPLATKTVEGQLYKARQAGYLTRRHPNKRLHQYRLSVLGAAALREGDAY